MIKTDKGKIEISGNIASMFADIGIISNTAKDILVEHGMTAEMAEEKIIDVVKKGFMSEKEIAKAVEDKITSLLGVQTKMIKAGENGAKLTGATYDLIQEYMSVVQGMRKLIDEDNKTGMEPGHYVMGITSLALGGPSFCAWTGSDTPPKNNEYVLLSFENFSIPLVGRYEEDCHGGAYYIGDDTKTCGSNGMIVNAWAELPKPFREEEE